MKFEDLALVSIKMETSSPSICHPNYYAGPSANVCENTAFASAFQPANIGMMSLSDVDKAKVKLITLLNVSSARNAAKRKTGEDWHEIARRAKKSKEAATPADNVAVQKPNGLVEVEEQADEDDEQHSEKTAVVEVDDNDDEDENGQS